MMRLIVLTVFVALFAIYNVDGRSPSIIFNEEDAVTVDPNYNETDLSEVHYLLWTRSNSGDDEDYELLHESTVSLIQSPFDDSKRTYFIFHGWGGDPKDNWILQTKTNLLIYSDCQVIAVNYTIVTDDLNYDKAVEDMYDVANYTASYIDWIMSTTNLTPDQIHIIGFSLGGQTAGMTGHYIHALVDRVTALDPAGPEFYTKPSDQRLDKTSGSFVDVIHVNAGLLDEQCLGLFKAVGHVDFYPNGGKHQPGCVVLVDAETSCSHSKGPSYWIESILETDDQMLQFWSYKCSDYDMYQNGSCFNAPSILMGFHTTRGLTGTFYLETNTGSPYAQYQQV